MFMKTKKTSKRTKKHAKSKTKNFKFLFLEKHIKHIIFIILIAVLLLPIFIFLLYDVFPDIISTEISADGMLSYAGAVLGGFIALFIAFIGICQNEKQEFEEIEKRKREIKPNLSIELYPIDEYFQLIISNNGNTSALHIFLEDKYIFSLIKPNETKAVDLTVNEVFGVCLDECEKNCNFEYPKNIFLIYSDIDWNIISENHIHNLDNEKHYYTYSNHGYEG